MRLKHILLLSILGVCAFTAMESKGVSGWPFFAPNVADEADLTSVLNAGDIVYDVGDNAYYGKKDSGWVEFGGSFPADGVKVPGATDPVRVTAIIGHSPFPDECDADPCTILNEKGGDWVDTVTRSSTGVYVLETQQYFTASSFINCNCSARKSGSSTLVCKLDVDDFQTDSNGETSIGITLVDSGGTVRDGVMSISCDGEI